jgi:hypothetical protein
MKTFDLNNAIEGQIQVTKMDKVVQATNIFNTIVVQKQASDMSITMK